MKELEAAAKSKSPAPKVVLSSTRTPTAEQFQKMTTDELVKLLMSPEMGQPTKAVLREQVITILQQGEGNAFVQRLLGKSADQK